jgi:hypothetical protein
MLPLQLLAKLCHYATPFLALSNLNRRLAYIYIIASIYKMSTTFLKKVKKIGPEGPILILHVTKATYWKLTFPSVIPTSPK